MATEKKSYHHWEFNWYFPKLRWWASFLLAAYIVGGFEFYWVVNAATKQNGLGLALACLYALPSLLFMDIMAVGHAKLMVKREGAASAVSVEAV